MYLRESRQKRADGSVLTHLQLAENVWDPDKQRAQVKIIYNCGRADDPANTERLRRLGRSILRRCAPEEIVAENPSWQVVNAWPYGDLYVLEQLWRRSGCVADLAILAEMREREERATKPPATRAVGGSCSRRLSRSTKFCEFPDSAGECRVLGYFSPADRLRS